MQHYSTGGDEDDDDDDGKKTKMMSDANGSSRFESKGERGIDC